MGDKKGIIFRMSLILLVLCLVVLIIVPVGSAEFYILAFSCIADLTVAVFSGLGFLRSNR